MVLTSASPTAIATRISRGWIFRGRRRLGDRCHLGGEVATPRLRLATGRAGSAGFGVGTGRVSGKEGFWRLVVLGPRFRYGNLRLYGCRLLFDRLSGCYRSFLERSQVAGA